LPSRGESQEIDADHEEKRKCNSPLRREKEICEREKKSRLESKRVLVVQTKATGTRHPRCLSQQCHKSNSKVWYGDLRSHFSHARIQQEKMKKEDHQRQTSKIEMPKQGKKRKSLDGHTTKAVFQKATGGRSAAVPSLNSAALEDVACSTVSARKLISMVCWKLQRLCRCIH